MFLFFEGFQSENDLILLLFSMKESDQLMTKIIPNVKNLF